jgi:DNA-binding beta-propeller fold protein YncE
MKFTSSRRWQNWGSPLRLPLSMAVALAAAVVVVASWQVPTIELSRDALRSSRRPTGQPQLTSVYRMPETGGAMCEWEPASAATSFMETLQKQQAEARSLAPTPTAAEKAAVQARPPVRMIKDSYPAFSSVAVDLGHDEVVMTDEATFQILAYNRTENTLPTATMSEPKRMIGGLNTWIEYQCGIYVDQSSGDVYAVNNDTVDRLVVFSHDQKGNVPPERVIMTPHTTYGIAVDESHQELFLTTQEGAAVVVFRKGAKGEEPPIRLLQGDKTLIADPHGVAVDTTRNLLFVSNFGSVATHSPTQKDAAGVYGKYASDEKNWPLLREAAVPGTGRYLPPSITVYPRDASGDVAPMRVIQGPKTQLNWPTALSLDTKRGEICVANDTGDSILVFNIDDSGNVAPKRMIKGPQSMVKSPTGVFYDWEHDEVWVSNFGNHTATVYKATASGDAPPLRVIRSAPLAVGTPNIGNAFAPSYDSKRDQLIVPN